MNQNPFVAGENGIDRRYQRQTQIVNQLPGNQSVGTSIRYQLSAAQTAAINAINWSFELFTDGYWYPSGATPLVQYVDASESTASATYAALTTAGPSITVPLAGDYAIEFGAGLTTTTTSAPWMSFDIGVTAAVDADRILITQFAAGAQLVSASAMRVHTGLASGTPIVAKYKSVGGGAVSFEKRWLKITPLRVQ
ncbi:MAG: hypothetical protein H0X39_00230 [Actinobacteria bacterium]|nr:hypothetical protein [Actinomycetota bacterium]